MRPGGGGPQGSVTSAASLWLWTFPASPHAAPPAAFGSLQLDLPAALRTCDTQCVLC
jgi:hypothetical protein